MSKVELFPADIVRRLRANGDASMHAIERLYHRPVIKIVNPYGLAMWLLTEIDPAERDHVYGLCDLGKGKPELGWVSREGLETAFVQRGAYRHPLERDASFAPRHGIDAYARAARTAGRITECPAALDAAAAVASPWIDWPPSAQPFAP